MTGLPQKALRMDTKPPPNRRFQLHHNAQSSPLSYTSMDSLAEEGRGHQLIHTEANPLHAVVWFLTGILGVAVAHFCTPTKTLTTINPLLLPLLNSRQSNRPKTWWGCFKVGGLLQGHPFQPFARSPPPRVRSWRLWNDICAPAPISEQQQPSHPSPCELVTFLHRCRGTVRRNPRVYPRTHR